MSVPLKIEGALVSRLTELENNLQMLWEDDSAARVHAARVSSRKVDAAVYLCRDSLRRKDVEFYTRHGERLRSATSMLRDCDVLLKRLEAESPAPSEKSQEKLSCQQDRERHKLHRRLSRWAKQDKLAAHRQHVLVREKPALTQGLAARIVQIASEFTVVAMDLPTTDRNVHRLRIATKKLRYAFEFLAECGFPTSRSACGEELEQLQTKLGGWTDELKRHQLLNGGNHVDLSLVAEVGLEQKMILSEHVCLYAFEAAHWFITQGNCDIGHSLLTRQWMTTSRP